VPMKSNAAPGGAGAGADRGDAGDREVGLRHTGGGQRSPLLRLKRKSIIGNLMAALTQMYGPAARCKKISPSWR
jgi:hypothetical protein